MIPSTSGSKRFTSVAIELLVRALHLSWLITGVALLVSLYAMYEFDLTAAGDYTASRLLRTETNIHAFRHCVGMAGLCVAMGAASALYHSDPWLLPAVATTIPITIRAPTAIAIELTAMTLGAYSLAFDPATYLGVPPADHAIVLLLVACLSLLGIGLGWTVLDHLGLTREHPVAVAAVQCCGVDHETTMTAVMRTNTASRGHAATHLVGAYLAYLILIAHCNRLLGQQRPLFTWSGFDPSIYAEVLTLRSCVGQSSGFGQLQSVLSESV